MFFVFWIAQVVFYQKNIKHPCDHVGLAIYHGLKSHAKHFMPFFRVKYLQVPTWSHRCFLFFLLEHLEFFKISPNIHVFMLASQENSIQRFNFSLSKKFMRDQVLVIWSWFAFSYILLIISKCMLSSVMSDEHLSNLLWQQRRKTATHTHTLKSFIYTL